MEKNPDPHRPTPLDIDLRIVLQLANRLIIETDHELIVLHLKGIPMVQIVQIMKINDSKIFLQNLLWAISIVVELQMC